MPVLNTPVYPMLARRQSQLPLLGIFPVRDCDLAGTRFLHAKHIGSLNTRFEATEPTRLP